MHPLLWGRRKPWRDHVVGVGVVGRKCGSPVCYEVRGFLMPKAESDLCRRRWQLFTRIYLVVEYEMASENEIPPLPATLLSLTLASAFSPGIFLPPPPRCSSQVALIGVCMWYELGSTERGQVPLLPSCVNSPVSPSATVCDEQRVSTPGCLANDNVDHLLNSSKYWLPSQHPL